MEQAALLRVLQQQAAQQQQQPHGQHPNASLTLPSNFSQQQHQQQGHNKQLQPLLPPPHLGGGASFSPTSSPRQRPGNTAAALLMANQQHHPGAPAPFPHLFSGNPVTPKENHASSPSSRPHPVTPKPLFPPLAVFDHGTPGSTTKAPPVSKPSPASRSRSNSQNHSSSSPTNLQDTAANHETKGSTEDSSKTTTTSTETTKATTRLEPEHRNSPNNNNNPPWLTPPPITSSATNAFFGDGSLTAGDTSATGGSHANSPMAASPSPFVDTSATSGDLLNNLGHAEFGLPQQPASPSFGPTKSASSTTTSTAASAAAATPGSKSPSSSPRRARGSGGGGGRKKNEKWLAKLEELKAYKLQYGDCVVPRGYPENPHLATWVAEQRKQYKLLRDGRPSNISQERIELLKELDFTWNAQEAAWDRSFQVLKAFQKKYGHCHVPNNQPQHRKLGLWVKEQRRHYSLLRQGKPSQMTYDRCQILNSVGFCWNTSEATWLERLKQLTAYKNEHGHCNVPKGWEENPDLFNFVQNQRKQFKQFLKGESSGGMTRERIHALSKIGFNWGVEGSVVNTALSEIEATMLPTEAVSGEMDAAASAPVPLPSASQHQHQEPSFISPPPPPPPSFLQPSLSFEEHDQQESTAIDSYYAGAAASNNSDTKGDSDLYGAVLKDAAAVEDDDGGGKFGMTISEIPPSVSMSESSSFPALDQVTGGADEHSDDVNQHHHDIDLDDSYFTSSSGGGGGGATNVLNVVAL